MKAINSLLFMLLTASTTFATESHENLDYLFSGDYGYKFGGSFSEWNESTHQYGPEINVEGIGTICADGRGGFSATVIVFIDGLIKKEAECVGNYEIDCRRLGRAWCHIKFDDQIMSKNDEHEHKILISFSTNTHGDRIYFEVDPGHHKEDNDGTMGNWGRNRIAINGEAIR